MCCRAPQRASIVTFAKGGKGGKGGSAAVDDAPKGKGGKGGGKAGGSEDVDVAKIEKEAKADSVSAAAAVGGRGVHWGGSGTRPRLCMRAVPARLHCHAPCFRHHQTEGELCTLNSSKGAAHDCASAVQEVARWKPVASDACRELLRGRDKHRHAVQQHQVPLHSSPVPTGRAAHSLHGVRAHNAWQAQEDRMKKAMGVLGDNFNTIRTGRANPAILDRIMVSRSRGLEVGWQRSTGWAFNCTKGRCTRACSAGGAGSCIRRPGHR